MKEHPIIFSTEMVKAILEGRKTMTRRVIKADIVYGLTEDRIYGILILNDTKEDACGRHNFIKWNPIEVNSCLTKRRLHGGVGWADLLTNKIQGLWEEGIRGLVSVKRTQQRQGLPEYFYVSPESQGDKECSQVDLYGISWITTVPKFTDSSLGRQSNKQPAGESNMGNSKRELDGQESSWSRDRRGETLGIQTDRLRATGTNMDITEGAVQSTPRRHNSWNVPGFNIRYSPFQVGSRLWVKETWAEPFNRTTDKESEIPLYKADIDPSFLKCYDWRPSIFMPRWASRILLEITALRVERLQEITEEDVVTEGIGRLMGDGGLPGPGLKWDGWGYQTRNPQLYHTAKYRGTLCNCNTGLVPAICAYKELWDSLNAKRGYGWDKNPWVWVITFKRLEAVKK